jgi:integrase
MGTSWNTTKHTGVRYRNHPTRKHGAIPDKYFSIRYQKDGKRKEEGLGWASDKWTASKAALKLAELKEAATIGRGHARLSDQRQAKAEEDAVAADEAIIATKRDVTYKHYSENIYDAGDIKPSSLTRENGLNGLWIIPSIVAVKIADVGDLHIKKVIHKMNKAGQSPRSVQYALGVIRKIINHAIGDGYFHKVNPVSAMKKHDRIKVDNKRDRFLTPEEANALLLDLKKISKTVHDMTLLSIYSGLRTGEIFALDWQHVDITNRKMSLVNTKNGKNRTVVMHLRVVEMFKSLPECSGDQLVFPSRTGSKVGRISKTFAGVVSKQGLNAFVTDRLQKVVFHTCRHTCASWLAQAGVPLYQIKEIMGHSTIAITERYSHLCPITTGHTEMIDIRGSLDNSIDSCGKDIIQPERFSFLRIESVSTLVLIPCPS